MLYGGETGGRVGEAVDRRRCGSCSAASPISRRSAFVRRRRPAGPARSAAALKPFRAGAICLLLGLALGLAAGSLGPRAGRRAARAAAGARLRVATAAACSASCSTGPRQAVLDIGAHILFVFLMVGGVLLLTGASLAGILRATGAGVATTTRAVRNSTAELTAVVRRRGPLATPPAAPSPATSRPRRPPRPPEPPGVEPVVHATHVEAPALDAEDRFPDLFADGEAPGLGRAAAERARLSADDDEPFEAAEGVEAVAARRAGADDDRRLPPQPSRSRRS